MCLRKLFPNWFPTEPIPEPIPDPEPGKNRKIALLFGINYPNTSYELAGCVNDIDDVEAKLNKEFPEYIIHKFKDNEVTGQRFYDEIKNALINSSAGDFILIWYSGHGTQIQSHEEPDGYNEGFFFSDGIFSDKQLMSLQQFTPVGVVVSANFDSCFAGGMDRAFGNPYRNRFHQMPGVPILKRRLNSMSKAVPKWAIFAASGPLQTSADAWFEGRANGAYTYYDLKCWGPGISFRNEMIKLHMYLPGHGFDQDPMLLGDSSLFDCKY